MIEPVHRVGQQTSGAWGSHTATIDWCEVRHQLIFITLGADWDLTGQLYPLALCRRMVQHHLQPPVHRSRGVRCLLMSARLPRAQTHTARRSLRSRQPWDHRYRHWLVHLPLYTQMARSSVVGRAAYDICDELGSVPRVC